jgi:hypothetical protein
LTPGASWTGWSSLGGTFTGTPAVTYHDGRFDLFAINANGAMSHRIWDNGWQDWTSLGGTFPANSGVTAVFNGNYHIFATATNGQVYEDSLTPGASWTGWSSLGGTATGTPAVTYHDGRFDLFAINVNGAMSHRIWDNGWQDWTSLGGAFPADSGVTAVFNGNYHIFATGTNGQVYEDSYVPGTSWTGWSSLGGTATGAPSVTYHDGRFDLFVKTPAGPMAHKIWDEGWQDWTSLGGDFT